MVKKSVECHISGPMALVLRISRVFGMAPLRFRRQSSNNSWYISLSHAWCIYSYFLLTFSHVALIMGVTLDIHTPKKNSLKVYTPENAAMWFGAVTICMTVGSIGAYCGPIRMKRLIDFINRVHEIKEHITGCSMEPEKTNIFQASVIWIFAIATGITGCLEVASYFIIPDLLNKDKTVASLYASFHVEYTLVMMYQLQFAFSVLLIKSTLQLLNNRLQKLLEIRKCIRKATQTKVFTTEMTSHLKPRLRNNGDSKLFSTQFDYNCSNYRNFDKRTPEELINQLSWSFSALCIIIQHLNKNYGLELLIMLLGHFAHTVILPYYMIQSASKTPINTLEFCIEIFWLLIHLSELLIIVEPCHCTYIEISRTKMLVHLLSRKVHSATDPLNHKLNIFYRMLMLNSPQFAPMGMVTLNRFYITSVMGGVTTYLVIVLQFLNRD